MFYRIAYAIERSTSTSAHRSFNTFVNPLPGISYTGNLWESGTLIYYDYQVLSCSPDQICPAPFADKEYVYLNESRRKDERVVSSACTALSSLAGIKSIFSPQNRNYFSLNICWIRAKERELKTHLLEFHSGANGFSANDPLFVWMLSIAWFAQHEKMGDRKSQGRTFPFSVLSFASIFDFLQVRH